MAMVCLLYIDETEDDGPHSKKPRYSPEIDKSKYKG